MWLDAARELVPLTVDTAATLGTVSRLVLAVSSLALAACTDGGTSEPTHRAASVDPVAGAGVVTGTDAIAATTPAPSLGDIDPRLAWASVGATGSIVVWTPEWIAISNDDGSSFSPALTEPGAVWSVAVDQAGDVWALRGAALGHRLADGREDWTQLPDDTTAGVEWDWAEPILPRLAVQGTFIVIARPYAMPLASSDSGKTWAAMTLDDSEQRARLSTWLHIESSGTSWWIASQWGSPSGDWQPDLHVYKANVDDKTLTYEAQIVGYEALVLDTFGVGEDPHYWAHTNSGRIYGPLTGPPPNWADVPTRHCRPLCAFKLVTPHVIEEIATSGHRLVGVASNGDVVMAVTERDDGAMFLERIRGRKADVLIELAPASTTSTDATTDDDDARARARFHLRAVDANERALGFVDGQLKRWSVKHGWETLNSGSHW